MILSSVQSNVLSKKSSFLFLGDILCCRRQCFFCQKSLQKSTSFLLQSCPEILFSRDFVQLRFCSAEILFSRDFVQQRFCSAEKLDCVLPGIPSSKFLHPPFVRRSKCMSQTVFTQRTKKETNKRNKQPKKQRSYLSLLAFLSQDNLLAATSTTYTSKILIG